MGRSGRASAPPRGFREAVRRLGGSFGLRLLVTLLATLSVVGIVRYQVTARDIEATTRTDVLDALQRQAGAISDAYAAHDETSMSLMMARALMDGMASNPVTTEVVLLGPDGALVAAARPDGAGRDHDDGHVRTAGAAPATARVAREVAATGAPVVAGVSDHSAYEFWVPVALPDATHVLHVGQDRSVIDGRLDEARTQSMFMVGLGLPIGGVVFFLLGGGSLVRRHRRAVDGSTRDALTGIGNHRGFQENLRRALARADRVGEPLACALIDIDDFKVLNDQAGHSFGDEVLRQVAAELDGTRAGDGAFRLGGDEFAVLMEPATAEEAAAIVERIRRSIAARLSNVTISIGIAEAEPGVTEADDLLARADAALYEAKSNGRNRLVVFHDAIWESQGVSPAEEQALQRILTGGEPAVALQPIFDLAHREPIGYEALARFPEEEVFAGPGEVFSVAHRIGRVRELDAVCRRAAFRTVAALGTHCKVFVNVAPEVFTVGEALGGMLFAEASAAGVSPDQLVIEVTEQRVIDPTQLAAALRSVRRHGFQTALDDVGAGNAGLELLRLVELDLVKIDRSVVVGALERGPARGVLLAIMAFAQESGCYVIAEGIESDEVLAFVDRIRVDDLASRPPQIHAAQGYLLGRPVVQQRPTIMVSGPSGTS